MASNNTVKDKDSSQDDCRISTLATGLSDNINQAIEYIAAVNGQTRLLSFNAQIEAARAGGQTGAAFAVVAQAIRELADRTTVVADEMRDTTGQAINEFNRIAGELDNRVRGTRLVDLALNNIDLIDRNLYERTCDVRWWATDASLVDACTSMSEEEIAFASKRMGIILSAYTVYFDLVLTDTHGRVIANGQPDKYNCVGDNVSDCEWFRSARSATHGDEYGFETCHVSPLVDRQHVLAYSCAVREGGEANGRVIGVLCALFNWDDLAQVIVKRTPLPEHEWPHSRVCIVDGSGLILADSRDEVLVGKIGADTSTVLTNTHEFKQMQWAGRPCLVAHAKAPGYETYTTGWHSLIIQDLVVSNPSAEIEKKVA